MTRVVQGETPMSNRMRVIASITGCSPMIQPMRRPVATVLLNVPSSSAPVPPASEKSDGIGSRSKLMAPYASSCTMSTPCRRHTSTSAVRHSRVIVLAAGFWKFEIV